MNQKIATNITSEFIQKHLKEVVKEEATQLRKISSGKRITQPSDDASGLAIATNLRANTQAIRQATRNATDAVSMIQTAEGGLNEISSMLIRLRELTIQSASDIVNDNEREMLDVEYKQLVKEIDRMAKTTNYNGVNLLSDEGPGVMELHIGPDAGSENIMIYDTDHSNATASALDINNTSVNDRDEALDSMEYIDSAINQVSGQRAGLGAIQSRLHSAISSLENQAIHQNGARSHIEDVDFAEATSKAVMAGIARSAATSALAIANKIPESALRLLD